MSLSIAVMPSATALVRGDIERSGRRGESCPHSARDNRGVELVAIAAVEDDAGTGSSQSTGDGETEAAAAAGYESDTT